MIVAKMIDKKSGAETLLIEKADLDKLENDLSKAKADLMEARNEAIGLNVQMVLLQSDLNVLSERYKAYDSNILCRGIIWLQFFIERMVKYVVGRIRARWEEE